MMAKIFIFLFIISFVFSSDAFSVVKYSPATNYNSDDKKALSVAETLSNDILKSGCFKTFMIDRESGKHSDKFKLHSTNGKTAIEVVDDLNSKDITAPVTMYYSAKSVVGFRSPPSPTIHTNSKFHRGANACARASNLLHEWVHVAGYGHTFKANLKRPFSVPYSVNEAFKVCCECKSILDCRIISDNKPAKIPVYETVCYRSIKTLWLKKTCFKKEINGP